VRGLSRPTVLLARCVSCGTQLLSVREALSRVAGLWCACVGGSPHAVTEWLSPWGGIPLDRLTVSHLVKTSSHFMGPECSSPYLQQPTHQFSLIRARLIQSTAPSHFFKIPKWSRLFRFPFQKPLFISLCRTCCIPCPSHPNHIPVGVSNTVSVDTVLTTKSNGVHLVTNQVIRTQTVLIEGQSAVGSSCSVRAGYWMCVGIHMAQCCGARAKTSEGACGRSYVNKAKQPRLFNGHVVASIQRSLDKHFETFRSIHMIVLWVVTPCCFVGSRRR
jgi:hypothetical protein